MSLLSFTWEVGEYYYPLEKAVRIKRSRMACEVMTMTGTWQVAINVKPYGFFFKIFGFRRFHTSIEILTGLTPVPLLSPPAPSGTLLSNMSPSSSHVFLLVEMESPCVSLAVLELTTCPMQRQACFCIPKARPLLLALNYFLNPAFFPLRTLALSTARLARGLGTRALPSCLPT